MVEISEMTDKEVDAPATPTKTTTNTTATPTVSLTPNRLTQVCKNKKLHPYETISLNDTINLSYMNLHSIDTLYAYTHIRALYLNNNAMTSLHGVEALTELKYLYLSHNQLDSDVFIDLQHLPLLYAVDLSNNSIDSLVNVELMGQCTALAQIDLSNNTIDDITYLSDLANKATITTINLSHNSIVNTVAELTSVCAQFEQLSTLDVTGNSQLQFNYDNRNQFIQSNINLKFFNNMKIGPLERKLSSTQSGSHTAIKEAELNERVQKEARGLGQMRAMQQQHQAVQKLQSEIAADIEAENNRNSRDQQQHYTDVSYVVQTSGDDRSHELIDLIEQLNHETVDDTIDHTSAEHSVSVRAPQMVDSDDDEADDLFQVPERHMLLINSTPMKHNTEPHQIHSKGESVFEEKVDDDIITDSSYVVGYLNSQNASKSAASTLLRQALMNASGSGDGSAVQPLNMSGWRGSVSSSESMSSMRSSGSDEDDTT